MKNLEDIFGLEPFRIVDYPPPCYESVMRKHKGEDVDFTARIFLYDLGNK